MSKKSALPRHNTDIDMASSWDGSANERRVTSPSTKAYFSKIYAWVDNGADETVKSSYRFIHHMVDSEGNPGAANMRALAAGVAALNGARGGTILDDAARRGVYAHLAAHYEKAGRDAPPLLGKSEIDSMYSSLERKSDFATIGSQVFFEDTDGAVYGTVVALDDGMAVVREWNKDEDVWLPTESLHDILASSITDESFLMFDPDEDDDDDDEFSTLPYATDGEKGSTMTDNNMNEENMAEHETAVSMTEQDFEVLVKSIAKLVIAEVGLKIDPPAGFSNTPKNSPERVGDAVAATEEAPAAEEAPAEAPVAEEAPAEEAPAEEVAAEEAPAEEAKSEEIVSEEAVVEEEKSEEREVEEKSFALTIEELKEFSDLINTL